MLQKCLKLGVYFGVGLGCVSAARSAAARDVAGAVQLSLDGSLVSYEHVTNTPNLSETPAPAGSPSVNTITIPKQTRSTTTFGLLDSGLGAGFGYGVSPDLILGVRAEATSSKFRADGTSLTSSSVRLVPRLEYLFDAGDTRPYVAAMLGVASSSIKSPSGGSASRVSGSQFLFGADLGLHAFLSPLLSIDPSLTFLAESGSETQKSPATASDGNVSGVNSQGYSVSGYQILFTVGLSAWLGGQAKTAAAAPAIAEVEAAPAPTVAPAPTPTPTVAPAVARLSATIELPEKRELDLEVASDPNLPWVSARLYVREDDAALADCKEIRVLEGDTPLEFRVAGSGDAPYGTRKRHFVAGQLPVHALTLLARPGSTLGVCQQVWQLSASASHQIHAFLAQRRELAERQSEPLEPEPSAAPQP